MLLGLFAILFGIDRLPLLDPDEGRNAEVAREMYDAREWIVPRFHGFPYLDKPALYFDAIGLSYAAFGRSEAASRLPSVAFAVGTAVATFLLGARLLDRRKALLGVAVLMTTPLFVGFARTVIFDMALTFFVVVSLLFAEEGGRGAAWGFPLAWVATGLAVLTKGPIGLLLPVLGTVALSLGQERPYRLRSYFHPLHLLLFFAVTLPWVFAVEARNPGFLRYAFVIETFERLTRPTFHRTGSIFYYVPVLLLGLFPWSLAALGRMPGWLRGARFLGRPSAERGLLFAAAVMIVFFSLSSSKLGGYVLPAFPLTALLIGADASRTAGGRAWSWTPAAALLALGIFLSAAAGRTVLTSALHEPPAVIVSADTLLVRVGAASIVIGVFLLVWGLMRRAAPAVLLVGAWLPSVVALGLGPAVGYAEEHSSRPIAAELRRLGGPDVRAAAIRCFPVGLDYYMGELVPVVTETGDELTSTYVARNFDELRGLAGAAVWSPRELESRLARKEVDILISRGNIGLDIGFRPAGRVGGYILLRAAGDPQ
jgi:4-amino-4-deoxy-L-arabinose transferase-like glycosyltransferase